MHNHDAIMKLTESEIAALVAQVADDPADVNMLEDTLLPLRFLRNINIDSLLRDMLTSRDAYMLIPPLFYNASPDIGKMFLEPLETLPAQKGKKAIKRNLAQAILATLAWIGGPEMTALFASWRKEPPAWAKALGMTPISPPLDGGWILKDAGGHTNLYHDTCYRLIRGAPGADVPIIVNELADERCQCGSLYSDLLCMNMDDPRLAFMGRTGVLRVRHCIACVVSHWGRTFCRVDGLGGCEPFVVGGIDRDRGWGFADDELVCPQAYVLDTLPAPITYAGHNTLPVEYMTVGGLPGWIQEPEYLRCPECGALMTYFAQMEWEKILPLNAEGIVYMQICDNCNIVGLAHQQT